MENLPIDAIDLASRVFYSESEGKIYFGDPINGYFKVKDVHNELTGLQGGTATQRYHLSQPEHEFVQSISPYRNPPTKGSIVFDPVLPPAIVGIGTGPSQLVRRDLNGNIKIDVKPFDDEDLADFGTVKEMTKYRVLTVAVNNELIETTTPQTLAIVTDIAHNTIRLAPATVQNTGYSVKVKVAELTTVLTPQGGSFIIDMSNEQQTDISLSNVVAEFISDGSNWQLVTVLR